MLPYFFPVDVFDVKIIIGVIGSHVARQSSFPIFWIGLKLPVTTVRNACPFAIIPDKAIFGKCYLATTFIIVRAPTLAVAGGPGFLHIISGISGRWPVMPIRAYFGIYIKIVQQYEFTGQGMVIRGNVLWEKA